MKRRIMLKLAVFLLLGAIINVAVAWACALAARVGKDWMNAEMYKDSGTPDDYLAAGAWGMWPYQQRAFEIVCFEWTNERQSGWLGVRGIPDEAIPRWVRDRVPSYAQRIASSGVRSLIATGWPCLTVRAEFERIAGANGQLDDGRVRWAIRLPIDIADPKHANVDLHQVPRMLPLRPIWPGFVLNTISFGAILWLLFVAPGIPGRMRRWRRINRGLCPACGYPVGTSPVCTECGVPVRTGEGTKAP